MNIGENLRRLRLQRGLTQEELADRCELTKGFISQVERNLSSPSIATLEDLLASLGSSLPAFFYVKKEEKIVFSPEDMFEKLDEETLFGKITWLVPDAQKNHMEPILIEIGPRGKSQELPPHEGEEFGYVLSGNITFHLGEEKWKLRSGDCFSVHPTATHYLENQGKVKAKVLWISNPPVF